MVLILLTLPTYPNSAWSVHPCLLRLQQKVLLMLQLQTGYGRFRLVGAPAVAVLLRVIKPVTDSRKIRKLPLPSFVPRSRPSSTHR